MKKLIILSFFYFSATACFAQSNSGDCEKFKTGNFSYRDSAGAMHDLKRNKNHQTDINTKNKLLIKYKIEWISACEYKLTQLWSNRKDQRKLNKSWQVLKIVKTEGNVYEYTCQCTDGRNMSGAVLKLSD